jgi:hypothetical protein
LALISARNEKEAPLEVIPRMPLFLQNDEFGVPLEALAMAELFWSVEGQKLLH